jgi:hypothetical protein
MEHIHAFITSDLGCEVGLTALARFLLPKSAVATANIPMSSIRDPAVLRDTLECLKVKPRTLNLCGDFWGADSIELVRVLHPDVCVWICTFDGKVECNTPKGVERKPNCTPTEFIINRAVDVSSENPLTRFGVFQNAQAIKLLDDRCRSVNVAETQPFFAGLCNIPLGQINALDKPLDLEDRIFRLLIGSLQLSEVLKVGNSVVRSQTEVARARVSYNSRTGVLRSGQTYAISEGSEFVNLTHHELHAKYPTVEVTIVVSLKFCDGMPDVVAHSMRAWAPGVDVKHLVGPHGGGGPSAAGARREINILLDY